MEYKQMLNMKVKLKGEVLYRMNPVFTHTPVVYSSVKYK